MQPDPIVLKLSQKIRKKIKDQDTRRRDFLRDSAPKNSKFHRLELFLFLLYFSYSHKNPKKFALVLFDF